MFNENLVNLIRSKYPECVKEGVSFKPAFYPHIVARQEEKARKHFVETKEEDETVLMLFDTSLFGKGKNGVALTDRAVYFKDVFGPTHIVAYKDWRVDADDAAELLQISKENAFLLPPFLTALMNEICTLKKYEGLFEAEEKGAQEAAEKAAREAAEKAAQEAAEKAAKEAAKKAEKDSDDDEDDEDEDDDDDGGTLLDVLGVVLDVTSDPSRE